MDTAAYLRRIGFTGEIRHDRDTLEALQRAHLTAVAFENLDVVARRPVHTDPARSVGKIVDRSRGGWCYELNGAFHALLVALGFEATLLGATVLLGDPGEGPQPDHATVEVALDRPYLVDVGFGDSFIRPIPLDGPDGHDGGSGRYRILPGRPALLQKLEEGGWSDRYRFERRGRVPEDFEASSRHLQRDGSHWASSPFATRLLDGGPDRVTLLADRIKFRRDGVWSEGPVAADGWDHELKLWFRMSP